MSRNVTIVIIILVVVVVAAYLAWLRGQYSGVNTSSTYPLVTMSVSPHMSATPVASQSATPSATPVKVSVLPKRISATKSANLK